MNHWNELTKYMKEEGKTAKDPTYPMILNEDLLMTSILGKEHNEDVSIYEEDHEIKILKEIHLMLRFDLE